MKNYLQVYLKNRPLFYSLIRPKEAALFHSLLPFKKPTLDFGCGDGFFAKVTFEDSGKIDVGLDIDEEKLREARKENIYKKLVLYKGAKLPFKSKSFSTVISNCVLEHLLNLDESLSEIYRVLKPEGKFVCTVMTDKWEDYLFGSSVFGSFYKRWMRKKQKHFNLNSRRMWEKVFKDSAFKVKRITGYLGKRECKLIDILHYVSSGSLITKKLFNKWVIFPRIYDIFQMDRFSENLVGKSVDSNEAGAIFLELEKK
jgi:ubiquinone/menaquinone biosynthesis C-methylase UbiE